MGLGGGKNKGLNYKPMTQSWQTPTGLGGQYKQKGSYGYYSPTFDAQTTDNINGAKQNIGLAIHGLQGFTSGTPEQQMERMYNGPGYETNRQLLQNPIRREFQQQQQQLGNDLNAKNLGGGSYDALSRYYAQQGHDYNLNQADLNARNMNAAGYQAMFNNNLQSLNANQNYQNQMFQQEWTPLQMFSNKDALHLNAATANLQARQQQQQQDNAFLGTIGTIGGGLIGAAGGPIASAAGANIGKRMFG